MPDQAPKTVPFRILGETDELLAVEKPPFLLVHPTRPGGGRTLWDHLRELLAYEVAGGGQVSLINRLDRETSGIVLVAKNPEAARSCHRAMKRGEVGKEYLAIVVGWPERDRWNVEEPILRLGELQPSRIWLKRGVHPEGAEARTLFQVEQRLQHPLHGKLALIRCHPLTGRTHQIRVHLAHSGHHVVGDKIYGPSEECYLDLIEGGWSPELERVLWLPRHALHSSGLTVTLDGRRHAWSSGLPADLESFLAGASPSQGCQNPEEAECRE
jgi:23S rRNA pseudouridine1911/1915/1917 synthase